MNLDPVALESDTTPEETAGQGGRASGREAHTQRIAELFRDEIAAETHCAHLAGP